MSSIITSEKRVTREINLASIPAFPAVVLRVLDIASQDDPDFDLLVREITSDVTLSAQVLRLANSSLFGFAAQIATVQHAVVAMGSAQIQALVMSVATANYSRAALRTEAMQKCWRHTLATAVASREIARAAAKPPELAYSLGLLHDIGRLGLLVAWPDDYNRLLQEADRDQISLLDLEKRLFNMDHCEVGRRLVEQWKLPAEFCVVTGRHHDPPAGTTEFDSLRIVSLGCRIAESLGYWVATPLRPLSFPAILDELPSEVRDRFPRDEDALRKIIENSVTGGPDALNQSVPDYVRSPATGSGSAPSGVENPAIREMFPSLEARPMAWDFAIVAATVLFMLVAAIVALSFLR